MSSPPLREHHSSCSVFEHPPPAFLLRCLFLLCSQIPTAFSWAGSVCVPNPSPATVSLCLPSPPCGAGVGFQPCLGCERCSPAWNPWCIPRIPPAFPLSPLPWGLFQWEMLSPPGSPSCPLQLKGNQSCGGPRDVPVLQEDRDAMLALINVCHTNVQCC